jgi:hypothetical protein
LPIIRFEILLENSCANSIIIPNSTRPVVANIDLLGNKKVIVIVVPK